MIHLFNRFLDVWLNDFRCVRRYLGGKWELLYIDPCCSFVWHAVDRFGIGKEIPPIPCMGFFPISRENWGDKHRPGVYVSRYDRRPR